MALDDIDPFADLGPSDAGAASTGGDDPFADLAPSAPAPVDDGRAARLAAYRAVNPDAQAADAPPKQVTGIGAVDSTIDTVKKASKGWGDTIAAVPGTMKGSLQAGLGGIAQTVSEGAATWYDDTFGGLFALVRAANEGKGDKISDDDLAKARAEVSQGIRDEFGVAASKGIYQSGRLNVEAARPANTTRAQGWVLSAAESLSQNGLSLVAGAMLRSPNAALSMMGATVGGTGYAEARARGLDVSKAMSKGLFDAAAEVAGELLPTKYLLRPGGEVNKRWLGYMARELPGEYVAELSQRYNDAWHDLSEKPTGDEIQTLLTDVTAITLLQGSVQYGGTRAAIRALKGKDGLAKYDEATLAAELEEHARKGGPGVQRALDLKGAALPEDILPTVSLLGTLGQRQVKGAPLTPEDLPEAHPAGLTFANAMYDRMMQGASPDDAFEAAVEASGIEQVLGKWDREVARELMGHELRKGFLKTFSDRTASAGTQAAAVPIDEALGTTEAPTETPDAATATAGSPAPGGVTPAPQASLELPQQAALPQGWDGTLSDRALLAVARAARTGEPIDTRTLDEGERAAVAALPPSLNGLAGTFDQAVLARATQRRAEREEQASVEGTERYQYAREKQQKRGRQVELRPLTERLYQSYVRPVMGDRAPPTLAEFRTKFPTSTHLQVTKAPGSEWEFSGVGRPDALRPNTTPEYGVPEAIAVASWEAPEVETHATTKLEEARAASRKRSERTVQHDDDLLAAISKLGGIRRSEAEAHGLDPKEFNTRSGIKPIFTRDGLSFDGMAELLHGLSFREVDDENGDYSANLLIDLVLRALAGEKIYASTPEAMDAAGMARAQADHADGVAQRLAVHRDRLRSDIPFAYLEWEQVAAEHETDDDALVEGLIDPADDLTDGYTQGDRLLAAAHQAAAEIDPDAAEQALERADPTEAFNALLGIIKGASGDARRQTDDERRGLDEAGASSREGAEGRGGREVPDGGAARARQDDGQAGAQGRDRGPEASGDLDPVSTEGQALWAKLQSGEQELRAWRAMAARDDLDERARAEARLEADVMVGHVGLRSAKWRAFASKHPEVAAKIQGEAAPAADVDAAAHQAATSLKNNTPQPTDAQKEAGNYAKGHVTLHGLDIAIENPKGSYRTNLKESELAPLAAMDTEVDGAASMVGGAILALRDGRPDVALDILRDVAGRDWAKPRGITLKASADRRDAEVADKVRDLLKGKWAQQMAHHYGYFKSTVGKDKDHIDVFLGRNAEQTGLPVFVVDQRDGAGRFDEHKVMLGFWTAEEARNAYLANYQPGWKGLASITELGLDQFKDWLKNGDTKSRIAGQTIEGARTIEGDARELEAGKRAMARIRAAMQQRDAAPVDGGALNLDGGTAAPGQDLAPADRPDAFALTAQSRTDEQRDDELRREAKAKQDDLFGAAPQRETAPDLTLKPGVDKLGRPNLPAPFFVMSGKSRYRVTLRYFWLIEPSKDIRTDRNDVVWSAEREERIDDPMGSYTTWVEVKDDRIPNPVARAAAEAQREVQRLVNDAVASTVPAPKMFASMGDRREPVDSYEDASKKFLAWRAALTSELGASVRISDLPDVLITDGAGKVLAHISSNGRVWPGREWQSGMKPLYDPAAAEAQDEPEAGDETPRADEPPESITLLSKEHADWEIARHGRSIRNKSIDQYRAGQMIEVDGESVETDADGLARVINVGPDVLTVETLDGKTEAVHPYFARPVREEWQEQESKTFDDTRKLRRDFPVKDGGYRFAAGEVDKLHYKDGTPIAPGAIDREDFEDEDNYYTVHRALVKLKYPAETPPPSGKKSGRKADTPPVDDLFSQAPAGGAQTSGRTSGAQAEEGGTNEVDQTANIVRSTEAPTAPASNTTTPAAVPSTTTSTEPTRAKRATRVAANNTATEDAGEELWYNRRNSAGKGLVWGDVEQLNATLRAKEVVKAKVWPRPDYEALIRDGLDPLVAHLVKQVYDSVAATARTSSSPTDADLKGYIEGVQAVRDAVFEWARSVNGKADEIRQLAAVVSQGYGHFTERITIAKALGRSGNDRGDDIYPMRDKVFPLPPHVSGRYRFRPGEGDDAGVSNKRRALLLGGNKVIEALKSDADAVAAALKAISSGWPAAQEAWEKRFAIRQDAKDGSFFVTPKSGRLRRILSDKHPTREAAIEAARKLVEESRTASADPEYGGEALSLTGRTGIARRGATENITSERLMQTFGFRGVNFGDWMKGASNADERQAHLNDAYDSFMDLADLLGVPPQTMSLGGLLGIAFGAQGKGGRASAHFIAGVNEINLTRKRGAGALAHEWSHALDHYFAVRAGEKYAKAPDPFMSNVARDALRGSDARPEVVQAFQAVYEAMTKRPETPDEQRVRIASGKKIAADRLDGWIKHHRGRLERDAKPEAKDQALADFDVLAAKLRAGDLGEGYVKTGRNVTSALTATVAAVRDLHKKAVGHVPSQDDIRGLENAASVVKHYLVKGETDSLHVPQSTDYMKVARALDGAKKSGRTYWSSPWELFARAFESYVMDELGKREITNDYLVRIDKSPRFKQFWKPAFPYPVDADRKAISEAIGKLLGTLQVREEGGRSVLFSLKAKNPRPVKGALSVEQVQAIVDRLTSGWKGKDWTVKVWASEDELPARYQSALRARDGGGRVEAFYDPDTREIHLVAGALRGSANTEKALVREVLRLLSHEGKGHGALRQAFGDSILPVLNRVVLVYGKSGLKDIAETYNLDLSKRDDLLLAAEERLAKLAEEVGAGTIDAKGRALWDRFVAWLRETLHRIGIKAWTPSEADIRALVADLGRGVETGDFNPAIARMRAMATVTTADGLTPRMVALASRSALPEPWYYSALARGVEALPQKAATGPQWAATIRNLKGVTAEEIEWTGVLDWLNEQPGAVTKQALADYLAANRIEVKEVVRGGKGGLGEDGDAHARLEEIKTTLRSEFGIKTDIEGDGDDYFPPTVTLQHGMTFIADDDEFADWRKESGLKEADLDRIEELWTDAQDIVKEIHEGNVDETGTSFSMYTLPGGESYRELLLTLPRSEQPLDPARDDGVRLDEYHSSHFKEPNIVAHVRFNDRTDADGKRVLFIEEIQSDWHQQGRKRGYKGDVATQRSEIEKARTEAFAALEAKGWSVPWSKEAQDSPEMKRVNELNHKLRDLDAGYFGGEGGRVPDAPFKTTWPELAMKRMLRWAAENGYDRIAWTTGEQQAERYDLSKHIRSVTLRDNTSGGIANARMEGEFTQGIIEATDHKGRVVIDRVVTSKDEIADLIGKDAAEKLMQQVPQARRRGGLGVRVRELSGLDLKVGGEGMAGFYDQMLPRMVTKLTKRWGGKVGTTRIQSATAEEMENAGGYVPNDDELTEANTTVHSLDITPAMGEAAMGGMPLFALRPASEYEKAVDAVIKDAKALGYDSVRLADSTPATLQALGAPNLPLAMGASIIDKLHYDHGLTATQIKALATQIADPVAIFESDTQPGRLVVLTDWFIRGRPVTIAINPNGSTDRVPVNYIVSATAREVPKAVEGWVQKGLLRYYNTTKAPAWSTTSGLRLPGVVQAKQGPAGVKVLTEADVVKMGGGALFSLRAREGQRAEREGRMLESLPKAPIERSFRAAFGLVAPGETTEADGWNLGVEAGARAVRALDEAIDADKFGFLTPALKAARVGLVDRYGLPEEYLERGERKNADTRELLLRGKGMYDALVASGVGLDEARALEAVLTGEGDIDVGEAMKALAKPVRDAIDAIGSEYVELGLLDRETFERNRATYLPRSYLKHESDPSSLSGWLERSRTRRRQRIQGDQFKGRGIKAGVTQAQLLRAVGDPWWGQQKASRSDATLLGREFVLFERTAPAGEGTGTLPGMAEGGAPRRVVERVWWPTSVPTPAKYQAWENKGVFTVRWTQPGGFVMWRDFTRAERERMGQVTDARYGMLKMFMQASHDLATGRMLRDIAQNPEWARKAEDPPPKETIAPTREYSRWSLDAGKEWVLVPPVKVPGTDTYRWGALAGMYVRTAIWRDLNEMDRMSQRSYWDDLLRQWKLNKTARNPVVHLNNVVSNLWLADLADVRARDLVSALRSYRAEDADYLDALQHGVFGSTFIERDIREEIMRPMIEALNAEAAAADSDAQPLSLAGVMVRGVEVLKRGDKFLRDLYNAEDDVFRLAMYLRRRALGETPEAAARHAREQFLNYDIRAPWVNAARQSVLPFISYTYRAVPVIAQSIARRPWKLAKYYLIWAALNALAYAFDDEGDEEEERRLLREQEQGYTWIGVPRMVRLPMHDDYGAPYFLDIRRWIPAGDVFDVGQSRAALPIPPWLQMAGPLQLAAEFFANHQSFTGQPIVAPTDQGIDRGLAVAGWAWRSWMPSAPWWPASWYQRKIYQAATGARDQFGRDYSTPAALASSVGIKVVPHDTTVAASYRAREFRGQAGALRAALGQLERDRQQGKVPEFWYRMRRDRLLEQLQGVATEAKQTLGGEPVEE